MQRSSSFLTLLISVLAILSPSAFRHVCGCSIQSAVVAYMLDKNQPSFYNPAQVSAHMDQVMASNLDRYVKDGTSTLSCVDARSDDPIIGTPGGDLAEFAMGLYTYNSLTNAVQSYPNAQTLFRSFMEKHISASRPFYFHTDDNRLRQVFAAVGTQLNNTNISILPHRTPSDPERNIWLTELVKSYAQGCGHIRLMIDSPTTYGMTNSNIIQWTIRAFYEELWAADTDAKRAKLAFVVKLGSLLGRAIGIVSNKQGTCTGYSPAIPPSLGGSTLFVFTPSAASAFRSQVMSPFFAGQGASGWNATQFQSMIGTLFNTQLGATLASLVPANQSSLITIDVTTVGSIDVAPVSPTAASNVSSRSGAATTRFTINWLIALLYVLIAWW